MLKQPLSETTFAFLDTETTGLSAWGGARVCEVAVVSVRGGEVLQSYSSLVNPECPIDPGASRIHGISDEMVASSPTFREVAPRLSELLEGAAMVCHNAPFDTSFLRAEFGRADVPMPGVPVVCTLRLARRHFKFPRNSLGHIASSLGIAPDGWHRAGKDVDLLRRVFDHFLRDLAVRKSARTLEDLLKL